MCGRANCPRCLTVRLSANVGYAKQRHTQGLRRLTLYYSGHRCTVEAAMRSVRQFALILTVLLPLLAPTMACALSNAHLSPAERACCKQMKGECGSMGMPASHGCCQKEMPTADHWNAMVQAQSTNIQTDLTAHAGLPPAILFTLRVSMSSPAQRPASTLPQSPPPSIFILRI